MIRVTSLLQNGIKQIFNDKKYDPNKIFINLYDLDNFKTFINKNNLQINKVLGFALLEPIFILIILIKTIISYSNSIYQIKKINKNNILEKLYILYMKNQFIQVIKQNKSIMLITNKLEKIYIDLWGLYNLLSQFKSIYTIIFIYKYIRKFKSFIYRKKQLY